MRRVPKGGSMDRSSTPPTNPSPPAQSSIDEPKANISALTLKVEDDSGDEFVLAESPIHSRTPSGRQPNGGFTFRPTRLGAQTPPPRSSTRKQYISQPHSKLRQPSPPPQTRQPESPKLRPSVDVSIVPDPNDEIEIVDIEDKAEVAMQKDIFGAHTVYTFKVRSRQGSDSKEPFQTSRRFREFVQLRQELLVRWPGVYIPPLPPKKVLVSV